MHMLPLKWSQTDVTANQKTICVNEVSFPSCKDNCIERLPMVSHFPCLLWVFLKAAKTVTFLMC